MFSLTFELGFCGVGATATPFELRLVFLRVFGGRYSLLTKLKHYAAANSRARADIERLATMLGVVRRQLQDARRRLGE